MAVRLGRAFDVFAAFRGQKLGSGSCRDGTLNPTHVGLDSKDGRPGHEKSGLKAAAIGLQESVKPAECPRDLNP